LLGVIEADGVELEQFHLTRQFQYLKEDASQLAEEAPAEAGQGVVMRVAAGCQITKGERVVQRCSEQVVGLVVFRAKAAHALVIDCAAPGLSSNEAVKPVRLLDD